MDFKVEIGFPEPMGAKYFDKYVNFAVAVGDGESCSLILYKKGTKQIATEIPFTSEMMYGNIYAMSVYGIDINQYDYNFRVANKIITDPYARMLSGTSVWGKTVEENVTSVIVDDHYDWNGDRPLGILFENSIIYRMHVRGFTKHSSSKVSKKGTFQGIIEKIPYLRELGINMIELMPAYEFREVKKSLNIHTLSDVTPVNYWGYTEGNYFAPKASYAGSGSKGGQIEEFRNMVKECHKNHIEVAMEFYFPQGMNQTLVIECFRFWVKEFHIDGIHCNVDNDIKTMLKNDPVLGRTKLICYDWNVEENSNYMLKSMSFKNLGEANDAFMIAARKFLKSDEGQVGEMSYRIKNNRSNVQVINYIANNGAFSLNDLVSFERKHNEANGENNNDGTEYNYSWNCGFEGKTRRKKVLELRRKQIKNMWIFLMLSQGTPMIYSGDEFLQTTQGNNNPYCQDNEISWLNWNLAKKNEDYIEFLKALIRFRNSHNILHNKNEMRIMDYKSLGLPDMSYHGSKAWYLDYNHLNRHFGVMYCGNYCRMDMTKEEANIYVAYNMYWENITFGLPAPGKNKQWRLYMTTDEQVESIETIGKELSVGPRSVMILISEDVKPVMRKFRGRGKK